MMQLAAFFFQAGEHIHFNFLSTFLTGKPRPDDF
jgi:hypothetical protein